MEMMNRAIEGVADYREMMGKIEASAAREQLAARLQAAMRDEPNDEPDERSHAIPLGRRSGENRAEHRARLKRERREAKATKAPA